MDPRVRLAARNNAEWCDLVCRTHAIPTEYTPNAWLALRRSPPLYPDAVTLDGDTTARDLLPRIDRSPGCSIKDSYASLDLSGEGFAVLFDAEWIHRPPSAPRASPWRPIRTGEEWLWPHIDPSVLTDPAVAVLVGYGGNGVIANRSATVVGLSNLVTAGAPVTTGDLEQAWVEACDAVAACFPGLPLVGYERDADLRAAHRAGFTSIGPLRVWLAG